MARTPSRTSLPAPPEPSSGHAHLQNTCTGVLSSSAARRPCRGSVPQPWRWMAAAVGRATTRSSFRCADSSAARGCGRGSVGSGVAARRGPRGCRRGQLAWGSQLACVCACAGVIGRARGVPIVSGASRAGCRPEDVMLDRLGVVASMENRDVTHLSITDVDQTYRRLWSYSHPLRPQARRRPPTRGRWRR